MPHPTTDKRWRHVTIGTYSSWLPGDRRGFRSRRHKVHSSGDHRHPPPTSEHAGLHRHAETISGRRVVIPRQHRPTIGNAMVNHFRRLGHRLLVLSVGGMHVHAQVELPPGRADATREVGRVKRYASVNVSDEMPGRVWARDCGLEPIDDRSHQVNTYHYILDHVKEGAWVWSYCAGVLWSE